MMDTVELLSLMREECTKVSIFVCQDRTDDLDEKRFWRDVQVATGALDA